MIRVLRCALVFGATTILVSCAFVRTTQNEPLDRVSVKRLIPGKTTAQEVVELFGGPTQIVELGNRSAYRYDHTATKGAGLFLLLLIVGNADTRSDRLWVFFDERAILTHYGVTLASHRPQYAMPWDNIYEQSDIDAADATRPDMECGGSPSTSGQ